MRLTRRPWADEASQFHNEESKVLNLLTFKLCKLPTWSLHDLQMPFKHLAFSHQHPFGAWVLVLVKAFRSAVAAACFLW